MYRLTTFAGLALAGPDGPVSGPAAQPRRLALLALLAAAGSRGLSRDKLLGLLWAESDAERARHALHQSLHAIRRGLGDQVFLGQSTLQLNPAIVGSDLADFLAAVDGEVWDRAVALYRGPLLDGFFLSGEAGFEEWLEGERSRLGRAARRALEAAIRQAQQAGNVGEALRGLERLVAHDPLDATAALQLGAALRDAGDGGGALRMLQEFEERHRRELGAAPPAPVQTMLAELRARPAVVPTVTGAPVSRDQLERRRLAWITRAVAPRYSVESSLLAGGTVSTFLGRDQQRGDAVTIAVVNPVAAAMLDAEQAARALGGLAGLSHPQLIPVRDAAWTGDLLYYVEERVAGPTLADRLKQEGPLPVPEALELIRALLPPLAAAHAMGAAHGDLRPRHIVFAASPMIRGAGTVAALMPMAAAGPSVSAVRIGAPAYVSPEQLGRGTVPDIRSDIYALGCILYEALAGEVPFASPNLQNMISLRISQAPPRLSTIRDALPPAVEALVMRMLARLPSERFASLEQLGRALAGVR